MWLTRKFSTIVHGLDLTVERLIDTDIGADLWPRNKKLLTELLFNREKAIAFDWQETVRINVRIA